MLTTFEGDVEIRRALQAGAAGYMLKTMPRRQLVENIRKVHAGKKHIPPEIAAHLAEHLGDESLSKREVDVLQRIAGGNRNGDIAALLFISEETVKGHVKHIMEKTRSERPHRSCRHRNTPGNNSTLNLHRFLDMRPRVAAKNHSI